MSAVATHEIDDIGHRRIRALDELLLQRTLHLQCDLLHAHDIHDVGHGLDRERRRRGVPGRRMRVESAGTRPDVWGPPNVPLERPHPDVIDILAAAVSVHDDRNWIGHAGGTVAPQEAGGARPCPFATATVAAPAWLGSRCSRQVTGAALVCKNGRLIVDDPF